MFESARKAAIVLALVACCAVLTSGCLYPKENMAQSKVSTKEAVRNMQAVIDQYKQDTGLLPIKNSTPQTPKFEKYVVDLAKLQRMQYISDLPDAAFENGGNYYFIILNEETDPTVKLMDLIVYQTVSDIQNWVNDYRTKNDDALPAGDAAYPGFYRIEFAELNQEQPDLRSIYSGVAVTAIVDEQGTVYIDYGIDMARTVENRGIVPKEGEDLRDLMAESYDMVPVKSPVYHWVNGEPRAVMEDGA